MLLLRHVRGQAALEQGCRRTGVAQVAQRHAGHGHNEVGGYAGAKLGRGALKQVADAVTKLRERGRCVVVGGNFLRARVRVRCVL